MDIDAKRRISGWFAGPKAENGEHFSSTVRRILEDYYSWRRNYYPEDGVVLNSIRRRENEAFQDDFDDRLMELLARLKADFPFQSPRYAAHMVAEQTLPSIAGYFAAMLYNPNNVTAEAAPVTVRLELEASQMIAKMLGYGEDSWSHLTSGGTVANIEALWIARTVKYLPLMVDDMRQTLRLAAVFSGSAFDRLKTNPQIALHEFAQVFTDAEAIFGDSPETTRKVIRAYLASEHNVVEQGLAHLIGKLGSEPVIFAPETHHYCFLKALDALGFGRKSLITVRVDSDFRMDMNDLEAKLDQAEGEGKHVLAVVAVMGTTEEGAIDPVDELLDLRKQREQTGNSSFWLHADAAYGGYLRTVTVPYRIGLGQPNSKIKLKGEVKEIQISLPERHACDSLERLGECDSITIDPHKLGYIPYPAGAICFKSDLVKPLARQEAPYLEESPADVDAERKSEGIGVYILEGSKPGAAAAAVWLSHKLIPLDATGHGLLIQETVRNAAELHALLTNYPSWTGETDAEAVCLCSPGSNIVCYAFKPKSGGTLKEINTLNRGVYDRFNVPLHSDKTVYAQPFFVSRTTLSPGQYSAETVQQFLDRLGVSADEYRREGVFLLRSVLMNPWYAEAKSRDRYYLSELVEELYKSATELMLD